MGRLRDLTLSYRPIQVMVVSRGKGASCSVVLAIAVLAVGGGAVVGIAVVVFVVAIRVLDNVGGTGDSVVVGCSLDSVLLVAGAGAVGGDVTIGDVLSAKVTSAVVTVVLGGVVVTVTVVVSGGVVVVVVVDVVVAVAAVEDVLEADEDTILGSVVSIPGVTSVVVLRARDGLAVVVVVVVVAVVVAVVIPTVDSDSVTVTVRAGVVMGVVSLEVSVEVDLPECDLERLFLLRSFSRREDRFGFGVITTGGSVACSSSPFSAQGVFRISTSSSTSLVVVVVGVVPGVMCPSEPFGMTTTWATKLEA